VIAGVVGHKRLESLGESNFLHRQKRRVSNALPKIIGNRKRATVESLSDTRNKHQEVAMDPSF
jgi:hypothetical protein